MRDIHPGTRIGSWTVLSVASSPRGRIATARCACGRVSTVRYTAADDAYILSHTIREAADHLGRTPGAIGLRRARLRGRGYAAHCAIHPIETSDRMPTPTPPQFHIRLREIMDARRVTVAQLAAGIGLSRAGVDKLLSPAANPRWSTVCAIADMLRVSPARFR